MKILITGGSGFVASHLVDYLVNLKEKHHIYVLVRQRSDDTQLNRMDHLDKIQVIKGDLTDYVRVFQILSKVKPDKIFHLAAHSFVKYSFEDPTGSLTNNIIAQLNLLEAVRQAGLNPIIHIAGSSEEYGLVYEDELPIKETNSLRPLSPYAVSKVTQEMMGYQYHKSYGMKIVLTRAFNHEGAGRGRQFFLPTICEQVARAEAGWTPKIIEIGDLTPTRDITHVKDMVHAYWLATEKCQFGEPYNIGSDVEISMQKLLDLVLTQSDKKFTVKPDSSRMRPSEVTRLRCDSTKFREITGWQPKLMIHDVVSDTLEYWRKNYDKTP